MNHPEIPNLNLLFFVMIGSYCFLGHTWAILFNTRSD